MKTRRLGNTDFAITPIGLGAWAIGGGGYAYGWGPQDDASSIAAIRAAIEAGINWIDTAPVYGLGHSEEVLARALEGISPRPYVFTKCGMVWNGRRNISRCLKGDSIRREIEASLKRLKVETLDLCQIHWPDPDPDIEEAWGALVRLKSEGKIRHIGVSNFSAAQMERIQAIAPIATFQPPYSLIARSGEESILPWAASQGIGVISYSPMKSGLLSGVMTRERIASLPVDDFRRSAAEFQEPRLSYNLQLVEILKEIGVTHGCSAGAVAIAWVLKNPAVTGAIVGLRSPRQLDGILEAVNFQWTPENEATLDAFLAKRPPEPSQKPASKIIGLLRKILSG
jgi:aryl-alcohol dehydrogenase-like predicted oxidoreductase